MKAIEVRQIGGYSFKFSFLIKHLFSVQVGKLLPCSEVQLKLAKKSNAACTINNLIKYCFKDLDLKKYSFLKLKSMNETLLANIYGMFISC